MPTPGKLHVLTPEGTETVTELSDEPSLEQLQAAVDGYIERVGIRFQGKLTFGYVNEDGKTRGLALNRDATNLLGAQYRAIGQGHATFGQSIVGNMAIFVPTKRI